MTNRSVTDMTKARFIEFFKLKCQMTHVNANDVNANDAKLYIAYLLSYCKVF